VVGRLPGQFEIQIAPLTAKFLYFVTVKTSAKIGVKVISFNGANHTRSER